MNFRLFTAAGQKEYYANALKDVRPLYDDVLGIVPEYCVDTQSYALHTELSLRGLHFCVSPDTSTIASAPFGFALKVWDVKTARCRVLGAHNPHRDTIRGLTFTPDGQSIITASRDMTVKQWSLKSELCLKTFKGHTGWVTAVAATPDGKAVLSASDDKTLKLWDLESEKCLKTLQGHLHWVRACALTPDGTCAVSASTDKTLKIWNLETGNVQATLRGHHQFVWACAVTPDGKTVISGSEDKTIKLWDVNTGEWQRTLPGHDGPVYSVAVTPDGSVIISAGWDGTLRFWDITTGACITTVVAHEGVCRGCAVTSDGKNIVSSSADRTLKIWGCSFVQPQDGEEARPRRKKRKLRPSISSMSYMDLSSSMCCWEEPSSHNDKYPYCGGGWEEEPFEPEIGQDSQNSSLYQQISSVQPNEPPMNPNVKNFRPLKNCNSRTVIDMSAYASPVKKEPSIDLDLKNTSPLNPNARPFNQSSIPISTMKLNPNAKPFGHSKYNTSQNETEYQNHHPPPIPKSKPNHNPPFPTKKLNPHAKPFGYTANNSLTTPRHPQYDAGGRGLQPYEWGETENYFYPLENPYSESSNIGQIGCFPFEDWEEPYRLRRRDDFSEGHLSWPGQYDTPLETSSFDTKRSRTKQPPTLQSLEQRLANIVTQAGIKAIKFEMALGKKNGNMTT